jgi:hypothetical protein
MCFLSPRRLSSNIFITLSSSNPIAATVGGTLGGVLLLLAILYLIYYLRRRRNQGHTQNLLQGTTAGTGNEQTRPTSVEKQSQIDDIENPPSLTYRDHHRRGTSSSSVPRDSRQFERSPSPQFDISHLSPAPLAPPQQHPTATTTRSTTTPTAPTATHPNPNPNATTNAQEEAELIHHLYALNIPTAEIAQLVGGMRAEMERLSDQRRRDARAGAGAGGSGSGSGNLAEGAGVQSTRTGEQVLPPRYDFKSQ